MSKKILANKGQRQKNAKEKGTHIIPGFPFSSWKIPRNEWVEICEIRSSCLRSLEGGEENGRGGGYHVEEEGRMVFSSHQTPLSVCLVCQLLNSSETHFPEMCVHHPSQMHGVIKFVRKTDRQTETDAHLTPCSDGANATLLGGGQILNDWNTYALPLLKIPLANFCSTVRGNTAEKIDIQRRGIFFRAWRVI